MAITLNKGGNLSLSKTDPSLTQVLVGLGWDARATDGVDFDLDASAFLLGANDKVRGEHDFIFYNQPRSPEGSVEHTGDNRTGAGDGDDELIGGEGNDVLNGGAGADKMAGTAGSLRSRLMPHPLQTLGYRARVAPPLLHRPPALPAVTCQPSPAGCGQAWTMRR